MKKPSFAVAIAGLVYLGLATSTTFAQAQDRKNFGKGAPFAMEELPAGKLKSKLQTLDPEARGKAMKWLHSFSFGELDAAHHLRADAKGGIFYICADHQGHCDGHHHGPVKPGAAPITDASAPATEQAPVDEGGTTPEVGGAAVPVSSPPVYNSKPGATRHIYIDFNGALVSGKAWSETDGVTTWNSWDCDAWSSDADRTTFSDTEQADIRRIWERLAEDYAPFDVNVTTDVTYDPATYSGDKNKVGWLLVTPTTDKLGARCPHYGAGGVAYVGVYGNSNYFSTYQPAWVTPMGVANTAEAASHEMGHNMGLSHDGLVAPASPAEYYGGHTGTAAAPSWGPIMGTGYGRNVSQWSKGEYYGGSQLQDDLTILNGRTPYRVDDHGGTFGTATVWLNATINQPGIIERTNDNDVFTFTTGAGNISFNANPYKCSTETWGGNVDIVMELYNSSQVLVASSNPANDVTAAISYTATAGDYYLVIKPTGCGTPTVASPNGYTIYGSLGQYTLTGTVIPANSVVLTSPNGGESWMQGSTQNITWASGMGGNIKIELFKNGVLSSTITATTANDGSHSWVIPSNQVLGTNYRVRITSLLDGSKVDESVSDFSVTLPPIYFASMDTNPNWTLGTGWGFGQPTGAGQDTYGNPDPTTGYSGSNVIGYRLDGDYEGSLTATRWATTPVINCSNYQNIKLNFWRWLGVEGGYDNTYIEASNNGTTWTKIWENSNTNGVDDDDGNWVNLQYDISTVANNQATVYIRWGMGTTDGSWNFCGWNLDDVKVTGDPMVSVGVVVTQSGGSTNVTEGGATDTYTVRLGSQPTANVTVNIAPNSQVSVSPISLTFTSVDWNAAQTVTVTAVNDAVSEFSHTGSIAHTVTSTDLNYNGFTVDGVLVAITDNDNIAPTVNAGTDQTVFLTGSVWSPTELNPIAWYDASDAATVTQVGGAVSQWSSKVGTSHMLQATGTKQPIVGGANQINGLNAIAFDGTDDALKTASNPFGASVSNAMVMAVTNIGTTVNSTMFSLTGGSTNRWQTHAPWGDGNVYFDCGGASGVNRVSGASGWTAGQNKLLGFYGSTTDNVQQVWANGTMLLGDATGHTVTTSSGLALGHDGAASYDNCSMGEVVILNSAVSATNRQKLEGYLAHKWSLQGDLPAAHPYKSQSPSNAAAVANLNGTVSDTNGDPLTTIWSVVSGPASVAFTDINAVDTTATFTVTGTYTLRLSASDPGATTNDDVIITVGTAAGYVVSYSGNGSTSGTAPGNQTKSVGVDLTLATNSGTLAKTGHTYAGWNTAANGLGSNYAAGAIYSTDADLALFAKWTPNSYTITFDTQLGTGGSTSVSATYGLAMPAATAPTRVGYTFGGYYTATNGAGTQYYTAAMASATNWNLTTNTTLFAKWTANTYTVTFNENNGTIPSPTTKVVTFGSTYGTLATTSRTGYTFNGWYTALTGGSLVSTTTNVTTVGNHTLHAQWTQVPIYTVTYNGNSNTGGTAPANQTKTQGIPLILATNSGNLVRTGYTFAGWNTAIGGNGIDYATGASYTLDADITLYAKWTVTTYVVSYNANGATSGTAPGNQTKTYNISLNLASNTGNLARVGYTFNGWSVNPDGSGANYAEGAAYTTNAALNLHAKWTPNTYAVTYDPNGATSGTAPAAQTKTHDTPLTLQINTGSLAKTNFVFAGWNTSPDGLGTTYAVGVSYTGNTALTLYARWTDVTYTVTYLANGSTGGSVPADQTKTHNQALVLASNTGGLVRTGYTFSGWSVNADGSGTTYAEGASYTTNANLTLYAKWTLETYVVSYDANSVTFSGTPPGDQTKTYNVSLNLQLNSGNLARTGYTFNGWNTAADGSGTSYAVGAAYTGNAALTLYARWTPNTYVVSYNANGATSGSAPANQSKIHDIKLNISTNIGSLAKTGYTFAGWNTAADGNGTNYAEGAQYETNAGLTLFAKWTANIYTVIYNGNGNTGGSVPADANSYYDSNLVTVQSPGLLTKSPYTFSGWNTALNGSGNTYYGGNSFAITGNVILYAQWSPAPVTIYEPFADTNATLTGNAVGTGLSGNWTADTAFAVNSTSLAYGSLPTTGGRVNITGALGTCSATIGTTLATNGLLTDGNSLWFSMIINTPSTANGSSDTGFAIGSGTVGSGSGIAMATNKQGIGFAINGGQLKAASWNKDKTTAASGSAVTTNTVMLVVGKIDWSSGNDVISLYRPDAAMNLGSVVSTHSAALSQTGFNIVSFGLRSNTFGFDEIRFGSTYEAVIGLGGSNQIDHFEISTITSPQIVGDPITNITITARNATNQTVTSFGGIVTFGGTSGVTGTSDNFVNGVITNISVTPSVVGSTLTFTVNDGAGHTGIAVFTVNSRYTGWTTNAFTNDFTDTSLTSNPDGDSMTNLQEFAFGLDPTSPAFNQLSYVPGDTINPGAPNLENTGTAQLPVLRAVFARRKDHQMAGLTYTVQFSADLSQWTPSETGLSVLTGVNSDPIEAVGVPYPASVPLQAGGNAVPKFFRLTVSDN